MRNVALFCRGLRSRKIIGALVWKIAAEFSCDVEFDWRNTVGGHGKVIAELKDYIRDLNARELLGQT